ncbi:hemicentin-1-like isoform X1 [Astyanax mexicanus]|uniref:Hemicentin-1-like isoform X1 n=1 Tax=Astyanax mexicanus TaxID=7994 RepID=A0A8T2LH47_ASTMX|nr:hemicentin-1-like isoform X1 [Astyanax mexicanus]
MALIKFILATAVASMVLSLSNGEDTVGKPTIQQSPSFSMIYTGEQVTLTCKVKEQSSDWKFYWYKTSEKSKPLNSDTSKSTYTINSAQVSDSGTYMCRVQKGNSSISPEVNHDLTVKSPPEPKITQTSGWDRVFPGEKVTLKCVILDKPTDWNYVWLLNNNPVAGSGDTLTISIINQGQGGHYTCQTELQNRPKTQVKSSPFTLTVYGNPTLLLRKTPSYSVFYPGEQVTFTCEVQEQSSDWKFYWYKASDKSKQLNSDTSKSSYTINTVQPSDGGTYVCQVKRGDGNFQHENNHDLTVKSPPEPKISQTSGWDRVFPGEKVTLKCEIPETSTDWKYVWFKNNNPAKGSGDTLTISPINQGHGGDYTCQTEIQNRPKTQVKSSPFTLTVYAGKPTLRQGQNPAFSVIYIGEQVTLTCEVQEQSSGWKYHWYKIPDKSKHLNSDTSTSSYTINAAQVSDSGIYVCRVQRGENFQHEVNHDLTIKSPPQPNIIQTSGWKKVFPGEKVILKCEIPDKHMDWKYMWLLNNIPVVGSGDTLNISSINHNYHGNFTCQTELQNRPMTQVKSPSFTLTVYAGNPTLLLEKTPSYNVFYTGEQVTLTCKVKEQSSDWKFYWYKTSEKLNPLNSDSSKSSYTINAVQVSDNGTYVCRVKRGDGNFQHEKKLHISVKGPPEPKINQTSGWDRVFPGEKVTLKCEIPDKSTDWNYVWFLNNNPAKGSGDTLTISSINQGQGGDYTCQTELQNRPKTQVKSSSFTLTVYAGNPTLLLEKTPSYNVFYTGEQVTLTCKIKEQSSDWKFYWYKTSDESKPLNSDTSTSSYTINAAQVTDNGTYVCRVKRGDGNFQHEKNFVLTVKGPPEPKVNQKSGWERVFPGEKVTLKCEIMDKPTDWKYVWFLNNNPAKGSGDTLTISIINQGQGGDYTCQSELQNRPKTQVKSSSFTLSVYARPHTVLTLETSWTDIMSVDTLTLKCEVQDETFGWNYTWYKDGVFEVSTDEERYSVKATEETFESEYKCRGNRTERPLYSSFSEGFRANKLVLKRKILLAFSGCVVCSIVLLIIGCIVLRVTRKPEKKEAVKEDLFISMTNSKTETSSPLQEYLKENGPPVDKGEHNESTASAAMDEIKDAVVDVDVLPAKNTGGFTSFQVEKSAGNGLKSEEHDESAALLKK